MAPGGYRSAPLRTLSMPRDGQIAGTEGSRGRRGKRERERERESERECEREKEREREGQGQETDLNSEYPERIDESYG